MFGSNWKGRTGGWIAMLSGVARVATVFVPQAAPIAEGIDEVSRFFEGMAVGGAGLALLGIRDRQGRRATRRKPKPEEVRS
jgi:hypothetical protein